MENDRREILVVMGALMLGLFLAALDQTIVATALPTIVGELGGLDHLSWVVTAYLLTSTVSVPLFGKISDLYGRKLVFQFAIGSFLVGSVLCGAAQDMVQLIVFRGIQGIGGGGLMAMTFVIMGDLISPRERGKYAGYFTGVFAMSSIIGPLVGGFFVDSVSWRWVFYVNLPLGGLAMAAAQRYLHVDRPHERRPVDVLGAVLLVTGVSCLLLVSVWGGQEHEWSSPTIVGLGLAGVTLMTLFLLQERRAEEPLVPLRLFANPVVRTTTLLSALMGTAMFGATVFMPLFLQVVTGASATTSGLLTLPMMGGVLIGSTVSGRVVSWTGRYKAWPVGGTAVATVGLYVLSLMDAGSGRLHQGLGMFLLGLGIGSVMPILTLAVQNAAEPRDLGSATSIVNFTRSLGGAFGVAVFGAIMTARISGNLGGSVDAGLLSSPEQIRAIGDPELVGRITAAIADGVTHVFLVATPLLALSFLVAWMLKELPLRETTGMTTSLVEGAEEAGLVLQPNVEPTTTSPST